MQSADIPVFNIIIPIYEGVDLLDVTAPYEVFSWLKNQYKERDVNVLLVAESSEAIYSRGKFKGNNGFSITPNMNFKEYEKAKTQCDLIWVPGGSPKALKKQMGNDSFMDFIRQLSDNAQYVTSVCEGALLLAHAGLLDGYTVTTHWAFIPCLKDYPKVIVAPGNPRFVHDRNRITGGGVSSGLDESLEIVKLICGEVIAQQIQLTIQYFPKPPVHTEIPQVVDCPLCATSNHGK